MLCLSNSLCGFAVRVARIPLAAVFALGATAQAQESAPAQPSRPDSAASAAPAPKLATVDIFEYDVGGNTVLPDAAIGEAVQPFLGPGRTPDDVDHARAALEAAYRDRGYKTVSVTIPRQTVRNGVVHLDVVENKIGHLNVIGSKYHSVDEIKAEAPSLAEDKVPDFNGVREDLVNLNQQADRQVTPSLKAGATPGTVDVDLVVDDHLPLHGSLEVDNRRSQDTSELRSSATLSYDNLWQRGHSFSLSFQTAPERISDARVIYGSYLAKFGSSPFSLLVSGLDSQSNVATVGGTDVVGKGQSAGFRGLLSLPMSGALYQTMSFGVDYKRFNSRTSLADQGFDTPVTYFPFSLAYTGIYRQVSTTAQVDLSANADIPKLGSTNQDLDQNRHGARGQLFYLRSGLSLTEQLPLGIEAYGHASMQWTDQPLITNEQFSVGGADTVRGYLEAEALGDYGYATTLELRSPTAPFFGGSTGKVFQELRLFAFYDAAKVKDHEQTSGVPASINLESFGGGLDMRLLSHFNGYLIWADPILDGPVSPAHTSRILFKVTGFF